MRAHAAQVLLALGLLLALGGCGLGAGPAPKAVSLLVTEEFGSRFVRASRRPDTAGQETVMSLLMRNYPVSTRYGGGFVQSIEGLAGGQREGQPRDWFYYVNGVQAPKGAAATEVHPGDHIWWDLHDWSQTEDVPAVVGSYPEPFLNGIEGERLPVRVECADVAAAPCRTVAGRLETAGVPAAIGAISPEGGSETLRVLVGPWAAVRTDPAVAAIESGPRSSGVYATVPRGGASLTLLDQRGGAARSLGAGAGLIAATRQGEGAPVWVVTGTDRAGLGRAAAGFGEAALDGRFAVAFEGAEPIALPEVRP